MPVTVALILMAATALAGICAGWTLCRSKVQKQIDDLHQHLAHASEEARTDSLTGLWNRKAFDEQLQIQTAIARRYGLPYSLVLLDVDRFKQVNDQHGHAAGDVVLKQMAGLLRKSVREADLVVRHGGDEFALLLPQTGLDGAVQVAERIRQQVLATAWPGPHVPLQITLSGGVAALIRDEPTEELLRRADAALYQAKRGTG
jgi:diguanylate cyclase